MTVLERYVQDHEQWRWLDDERRRKDIAFFQFEAGQDEYQQAMSYALMPLTATLESLRQHPLGKDIATWCVNQGQNYAPANPISASDATLAGCLLGSLLTDILSHGHIRSGVLSDGFARIASAFAASPRHWARLSGDTMNLAVLKEIAGRFGRAAIVEGGISSELLFAVQTWQRLHWLAECRLTQALVLSARVTRPLPSDPYKRFSMLHRLAWSQPLLRRSPALARTIPDDPVRILPPGAALGLLVKEFARADKQLEQRFLADICHDRRYSLDHVAIIDLEQSGLNTITMAPEQRYRDDDFTTTFAVDHREGVFFGETHLLQEQNRIFSYLPLCDSLGFENRSDDPDAATPNQVLETFSLLIGAAWRDLVSGRVRDEHYVSTIERKARNGKGRRAESRGDVDVVRYLPRRVAARREQVALARESGGRVPPRRYAVGAFSRRLPAGQKRSDEAEAFANEIGIPLAPYQTVVHPHFRGGSEEDKVDTSRRYRSWSALDLLRTRD